MGDSRRPILILAIVLFVAGVGISGLAVVVAVWLGASPLVPDKAALDAREAAVRTTDLTAVRGRLNAIAGWRVVALRAEASYYTEGSAPVNQRWGMASNGDVIGPDAALVLGSLSGGNGVRFAVVGQCSGTDEVSVGIAMSELPPDAAGTPPPDVRYAKLDSDRLACDGHAHVILSEPYTLPADPMTERQWVHLFFGARDENAASVDRFAILVQPAEAVLPNAADLTTQAETAFGGALP